MKELFGNTIKSFWSEYQAMVLALLSVVAEITHILQMVIPVLLFLMFSNQDQPKANFCKFFVYISGAVLPD